MLLVLIVGNKLSVTT